MSLEGETEHNPIAKRTLTGETPNMSENNDNNKDYQTTSTSTCQKSDDLTPLQQRQIKREKEKRAEFIRKKILQDTNYEQQGSGSQARASKGLLQVLVPAVALWLDRHDGYSGRQSNYAAQGLKEFRRLKSYLTPEMMAHIAITVTLDSLGRGTTFRTTYNSLCMYIGKHLEDQAFMEYMNTVDPYYFSKLQKKYLHDPVRRYDKKVYVMKYALDRSDDMQWHWMPEEALAAVGGVMVKAVLSIRANQTNGEGFFKIENLPGSRGGGKSARFLMLSETGVKYRDKLLEAANRLEYKPLPMLCEPLPWSLTERGGYLLTPPREFQNMIHSHNPSIPSPTAIEALNKLQSIPYRINEYILDLQQHLLKKTHEIGCFRTYEKDSWKEEHFPLVDSDWLDTLDKESEEYKQTMKRLKDAYHQQKLDEKEGVNPIRISLQADELRGEVFYTPWFFDSRLRLYPMCELGVTRGDFVKALMVNANPLPITEDTRRELLIAIATSGDFGKVSKKDYFERMQWAEEFVASGDFKDAVLNPESNKYWREADEPFQFLAYCEEYYALYVAETRNTTRVFIGRDMSCSGIQFLSSLIGDEKAMRFTNVIPSDTPQDAYGEVARVARELLSDKEWVQVKLVKRESQRVKRNEKYPDNPRDERMFLEIDINTIDRGIVKTQVMVTGYGGTYLSKREYIIKQLKEAIEEKGAQVAPEDFGIIVDACIEGMAIAFPKYTELNDWFKTAAKAACNAGNEHLKWITPNGSYIAQDYREPDYHRVSTYAANGGHYATLQSDNPGEIWVQKGWKDEVKTEKHCTGIAANFTHSLDACMIQNGVVKVDPSIPVFTVHDCVYFQPGYSSQVVPQFRQAFYGVVTTPVLESLLEENGVTETVPMIQRDKVDVSVCKDSPYMFS